MTAQVLVAAEGASFVSPDDLAGITPLWQQAVDERLLPVVAEVYRDSAGTLHTGMVEASNLPNLPTVTSLASEQYLAQAANTFEGVGADLWETARSELLDGMQQGESIPELRDRLRASAGMTARRATLVARTQVLDASNAGSYDTARVSGLDLMKGWEATPDFRTRESHLMAGSTYSGPGMIGLTDLFMVGGWPCERPHDISLPASERYNCRCTLVYRMREAAPLTTAEEQLAELQREHDARIALLRGRFDQRKATLEARHAAKMADLEAGQATYEQRQSQILSVIRGQGSRRRPLSGESTLITSRSGRRVVLKLNSGEDAVRDMDAEELASRVRNAIDSRMPVAVRLDSTSIGEEYVPGVSGDVLTEDAARLRLLAESDEGRRAGLGDILTADSDRGPHNLILTEDGRVVPIDYGASFRPDFELVPQIADEFSRPLLGSTIDINPADMAIIRTRLAALRPEFERLGHSDWHDAMMDRFDRVAAKARGPRSLLADTDAVPGDQATHIAKAVAEHEHRMAQALLAHEARVAERVAEHERRVALLRAQIDLDVEVVQRQPTAPSPGLPEIPRPAGLRPTEVPVRPSLLAAQTIPEVRAAFIREWREIAAANPGAIRGSARFLATGDVQTAREHAEGLLRAIERFPLARLDVSQGDIGQPYAHTVGRMVVFNNAFARARDDYLLSLRLDGVKNSEGISYHPMSINSPQGTAMHEFAHALHFDVALGPDGLYDYGVYTAIGRRVLRIAEELADEQGVPHSVLIQRSLGIYAADAGNSELTAEAFADVMVNGPAASELSRRIFTFLAAEYDRVLRGAPAPRTRLPRQLPALPSMPAPAMPDLESMTLARLKALATERGITVAPRIRKADLITQIRLTEEMEQRLANAIAEAIDVIERAIPTKGVLKAVDEGIKLLTDYPGGELALARLRLAPHGANAVIERLRRLAEQRGLTLPTGAELRALKRARAVAKREAALAARAEKQRLAAIKRQVKAIEGGDLKALVREADDSPWFTAPDGVRWRVDTFTSEQAAREHAMAVMLQDLVTRADTATTPITVVVGRGAPGLRGWQVAYRGLPDGSALPDVPDEAWTSAGSRQLQRVTVAKLRALATKAGLSPNRVEALLALRTEAITTARLLARTTPSRNAPLIGEVFDTTKSLDDPQLVRRFGRWINGRYGKAGLRAQVTSVELHGERGAGGMLFQVYGDIYSGKRSVGQFSRFYHRDDHDPSKIVAHHDLLDIAADVRGTGFAEQFNANFIDWYRRSGVDRIELGANIDVGGYAWASAGYDFAEANDALGMIYRFERALGDLRSRRASVGGGEAYPRLAGLASDELAAQIRAAEALLAKARQYEFGDRRYPTAYDFSQIGRHVGQGKDDMWLGKAVMLGSYWGAVLYL